MRQSDISEEWSHSPRTLHSTACISSSLGHEVYLKIKAKDELGYSRFIINYYNTAGGTYRSLEDDVLQDCCCSWRTALRRLLNLPFNAHCFLLLILTCTLPVFYEICKSSSRFINSCLRSCYNLVMPCTALFVVNIIRLLVEILGFLSSFRLAAARFFC